MAARFYAPAQTGYEAHPIFLYTMGTALVAGVKRLERCLDHRNLLLAPRLNEGESYNSMSSCALMACWRAGLLISAFVLRPTSPKFGLYTGNMKFITPNKERKSIGLRIIICIIFLVYFSTHHDKKQLRLIEQIIKINSQFRLSCLYYCHTATK